MYVSSYYYTSVLILLYMRSYYYLCVLYVALSTPSIPSFLPDTHPIRIALDSS